MKHRKYQKQELKKVIKESRSIRECLIKLNIVPAGGNYQTIKRKIQQFDIDISHFKGQSWNSGSILKPKVPIEKYLSNEKPIQSFKLKNRLLREEYFPHQCSNCNLKEWLGEPIPIELDHIDGDSLNNNLNNLRLLCPNCHALTPTYRGRNISKT